MRLTIGLLLALPTSTPHAAELIRACDIGTRVAIVRDYPMADTHIYYLRQNGKRTPLFGEPEQSRGSAVLAECVGKKIRALVVLGAFTANFLQGFVLTYRPESGVPERMDFAEKNRPQWLYLSAHEIIVIIPTYGYGETSSKYAAYHHVPGRTDLDRTDGINQLPSPTGFEVVDLRTQALPAKALRNQNAAAAAINTTTISEASTPNTPPVNKASPTSSPRSKPSVAAWPETVDENTVLTQ
ncbi:hypothetical protein L1274_004334 [Duganella sp. HSC-15S17]|uniref:Uncharacterized protein n=1 Tax=Duganella violaceipulchra TaxID=2849652 RepID=A0ABT1GQV9_9BURK|nr:hypothetical protein [Duganella violaceicalia]